MLLTEVNLFSMVLFDEWQQQSVQQGKRLPVTAHYIKCSLSRSLIVTKRIMCKSGQQGGRDFLRNSPRLAVAENWLLSNVPSFMLKHTCSWFHVRSCGRRFQRKYFFRLEHYCIFGGRSPLGEDRRTKRSCKGHRIHRYQGLVE